MQTPPSSKTSSDRTELFQSFFLGGFECSTHERRPGERLDLLAATAHDRFALRDYRALQACGIRAARDGIRWHRIERTPGIYTFSADLSMIRAALQTRSQVIWDLCHYGWPDDISPFEPEFGRRLAGVARAFVRLLLDLGETRPFVVPINEISFLSWMGGTEGRFPPFARGRGEELKRCLVRAALETIAAVREIAPHTRICAIDPVINVVCRLDDADAQRYAADYNEAQFAVFDMLSGRIAPELGGRADFLDIIGVNYYVHNQWAYTGPDQPTRMLRRCDPLYRRPLDLLRRLHRRYGRPLFLAETGIEDRRRPVWLRYICDEVAATLAAGVPLHGVCLYPILDYPGWVDDRHCPAGLFGYADEHGHRPICWPLKRELDRQMARFARLRSAPDTLAPRPHTRHGLHVPRPVTAS
jgi:beta-glucosidase/6-phospho-beta-glucosidase/beta-galactosidase